MEKLRDVEPAISHIAFDTELMGKRAAPPEGALDHAFGAILFSVKHLREGVPSDGVVFVDERVERRADGKIDVVRKAQQREKRKPENEPPFFLMPAFDRHHGEGEEENHGTGDDKPRQVIHN